MCLSAGMIEPADECMHSQSAFVNLGISTLESAKKDICILGCDDEHDGKSQNIHATERDVANALCHECPTASVTDFDAANEDAPLWWSIRRGIHRVFLYVSQDVSQDIETDQSL